MKSRYTITGTYSYTFDADVNDFDGCEATMMDKAMDESCPVYLIDTPVGKIQLSLDGTDDMQMREENAADLHSIEECFNRGIYAQ